MNLFPEEIPLTSNQKELVEVQKIFHMYGLDYVATASIKERRDWIELMWKDYEGYAEDNFRTEFKTKGKFNQKTWELYLSAFLKSKGFEFLTKTGEGPDFHIKISDKDIWIEANAPTVGEVDPAPEKPDLQEGEIYTGGGDMETTYRTKVLRLTNAIRNKSNKISNSQYYKGRLSGSIKENDCYIIAINGHDFCGLVSDPSFLLRRTLFSAGCLSYERKPDGSFEEGQYLYQPFVIKNKPDGTIEQVPTDIFSNSNYCEISAIIYSPHHIINAATDLSKIGDKLTLIRNPFAKNKLPTEFPVVGSEWIYDNGVISEKIDQNIVNE